MSLPNFTAQLSLNININQPKNNNLLFPSESKEYVKPAYIHWGSIGDDGCVEDTGYRQYSAILWGIPWGQSWEQACFTYGASVGGQPGRVPDRCRNTGFNIWGIWYVRDQRCG